MKRSVLAISAFIKYLAGLILVGALLFLPAGTLRYFNGWLFIGLLFIPMLALGTVLLVKKPELLEKRLRSKEKEGAQKGVVGAAALMFVAGFAVAGLDARFTWSHVPLPAVIAASVILLISYGLYGEVMRENAYLSRTVEVEKGQKVISTGLRHYPPSHVCRHGMALSVHTRYSRIMVFPFVLCALRSAYRSKNSERGKGADTGAFGICRVQKEGALPPNTLYMVKNRLIGYGKTAAVIFYL